MYGTDQLGVGKGIKKLLKLLIWLYCERLSKWLPKLMKVIPNLNFEFHLPSTSEAIEGAIHGLADIVEHYDLDAYDLGPLHVV